MKNLLKIYGLNKEFKMFSDIISKKRKLKIENVFYDIPKERSGEFLEMAFLKCPMCHQQCNIKKFTGNYFIIECKNNTCSSDGWKINFQIKEQ